MARPCMAPRPAFATAAVGAILLIGRVFSCSERRRSNRGVLMKGTLYVFLHGLTVSRERWNMLEVVLPRVSGHILKAGSWLAETPLRNEGLFQLRGVRTPP